MKKLISILLIFVLLASTMSLLSCSEDEANLDVKSYDGFVAFVFGIESGAANFFAKYTPFATTRTSLDSFLKLGNTVSAGLANMSNKLMEIAKSIFNNPANLVLTILWGVLYLIGVVFVLALTAIVGLFLLTFFLYAIIYDTLMISMYGLTVSIVFMFRAFVYVFVDLGIGAWLLKKLLFPTPF